MQGLLALVPLVLQVLPKLAPIFGTPLSGGILDKAGQVAKEVFGTTDAAQIQLQLEQDKNKLEAFNTQLDAAPREEQAYFADVQSARAQTMALAQVQSPIAYGAPIMSDAVTVGFIVVLTLFVSYALKLDAYQQSVVTILIGYLGAAFQQAAWRPWRDRAVPDPHRSNSTGKGRPVGAIIVAYQIGERLIGTLRRECLDHVLIFGERHLHRVLASYSFYYNETRTHLGLGKDAPLRQAIEPSGTIIITSVLSGLHHRYPRI
jgi:hypothetical protein